MKRAQLKTLIKEIITQTFNEMKKGWSVDEIGNVTIDSIQLPDGQTIGVEATAQGHWYGNQFEIERFQISKAWTTDGYAVPLTPELVQLIETELDAISADVAEDITVQRQQEKGGI